MGQQEPIEAIGQLLRDSREKLGLSHSEIERSTHIRARYLEALESGDLESLPSPVQARGFLRNYAAFLGLDADQVLLQFADQLEGNRSRPAHTADDVPPTMERTSVRRRRPAWLSSDLFVAVTISLIVLVVLLWGGSRVLTAIQQDGQSATPSGFSLVSSPSPSASPTIEPSQLAGGAELPAATPSPEGTLPAALLGGGPETGGINLRILVEKRSWLSVVVDGDEAFRGRAKPGDILEFQAQDLIRAITGNGDGLRVVYNGQDQGRLGDVGEVVTRLWDLNGAITPTPTPSMTPSPTPLRTATATMTGTPLP
ncbi:MAG: RodZ domain-containing protein [Anaerolineales bacterium]